ncbi:hypothetical protein FKM82_026051 [Ascaphus truei]
MCVSVILVVIYVCVTFVKGMIHKYATPSADMMPLFAEPIYSSPLKKEDAKYNVLTPEKNLAITPYYETMTTFGRHPRALSYTLKQHYEMMEHPCASQRVSGLKSYQ